MSPAIPTTVPVATVLFRCYSALLLFDYVTYTVLLFYFVAVYPPTLMLHPATKPALLMVLSVVQSVGAKRVRFLSGFLPKISFLTSWQRPWLRQYTLLVLDS